MPIVDIIVDMTKYYDVTILVLPVILAIWMKHEDMFREMSEIQSFTIEAVLFVLSKAILGPIVMIFYVTTKMVFTLDQIYYMQTSKKGRHTDKYATSMVIAVLIAMFLADWLSIFFSLLSVI